MKPHTDEPIGLLSWSLIILGGIVVALCVADLIFGGEVVTEVISGVIK